MDGCIVFTYGVRLLRDEPVSRERASALTRTTSGSRASRGRTSRPGCSRLALSFWIRICFTVISSAAAMSGPGNTGA